ncbi:LAGLIDADG family homing endonuclease [Fredinandcohnia sp. 179-A 10B2 NHS]
MVVYELGSNQPLQKNEKTGVYLLNLNSKVLKDDLINIHGITPNKSSTVLFPFVPDAYLSHFIRGYFDGDGNINYQKYVVSFVGGSFEFMNALYELLRNKGFNPQIIKRQNYYRVIISDRLTIQLFAQWIYTNGNLYLNRKLSNFLQEQHPKSELVDRKHKRTKHAVSLRKKNFLKEYQQSSCLETSCAAIGIKQSTFYKWCKADENFHKIFNDLQSEE